LECGSLLPPYYFCKGGSALPHSKGEKMNWDLVRQDPYYRGREIEAGARQTGSIEAWLEFASLKAGKGSYALAVHGLFSAALLSEKQGALDQACTLLAKAFHYAGRARSKELAMIVAYHHAMIAEQAEEWDVCIEVYESLGRLCEDLGSYFMAADAYEHAAEVLAKAGGNAGGYSKPEELWRRNAEYWHERGHEDDAQWSERHIELYGRLMKERAE
jgi:hypothetical protein